MSAKLLQLRLTGTVSLTPSPSNLKTFFCIFTIKRVDRYWIYVRNGKWGSRLPITSGMYTNWDPAEFDSSLDSGHAVRETLKNNNY